MKRIGVITYWNSKDNYGQILQCYALQNYLQRKGFEAFLIKYQPIEKKNIANMFKDKVLNNVSLKRIKYYFSNERKQHIIKLNQELKLVKDYETVVGKCQFDAFRNSFIVSSNQIYHSIDELRNNAPSADAYICGSDQVWNNDLFNKNTAGWFLDFTDKKRISYAASIGRTIKKDEEKAFNIYLKKFYAISVREESALAVCHRLGYKNAQIALDPTLLLTKQDYLKLLSKENYDWSNKVFVYVLNIANKDDLHWKDINEYAELMRVETEICCSSGYICARELVEDKKNLHLTVGEWLRAVSESKCVITSSFHGTVFSIIFHTPFVVIPLVGKNEKANDRIITLLNTVDLGDRILTDNNTIEDIMDKSIDWDIVDHLIECNKISSIGFLDSALKGI